MAIFPLLATFLLACPRPLAQIPQPVQVPLDILRTRHIAVQTKINGQGPFRLVLDTGAPITFINRRVAVKLGLMKADAAKQPMMLGMGGQVKVKTLEVGGAKATDVPVIILDHPIVEMIGQVEGGIDGIVGYTFWGRFDMTLDYQAKQVTFGPSNYQPEDVLSSVMTRLFRTDERAPVVAPGGIWGMAVAEADGGIVVKSVTPGWPAAMGNLQAGDKIKSINLRWTDSMPDLADALSHAHANDPAEVVALREGREVHLQIRPKPGL